jgi:TRAP transporter TAXI family solute receptor
MIKKTYLLGAILAAIIVIGAGIGWYYYSITTAPSKVEEPVTLNFVTQSIGTSWYLLGGVASGIFQEYLPAGSRVDVLPYGSGGSNPILVDNGTAKIGLTFDVVAKVALKGEYPYAKPLNRIRVLAAPLDRYWWTIGVRKDSDIKTWDDIINPKRPIKIGTAPPGTATAELALRWSLEAYGLTYDDLKAKGVTFTFAGIPTLAKEMQAGRLDAIAWVSNPGHPTWSELFINPGMRWLPLPDKVVNYLVEKYGWKPATIPAEAFPGSNEVKAVGHHTIVIVRDDMPDALAYMLAKALAEGRDKLTAGYPASKGVWDPSKWKEFAIIPYHPGAERYYRERFGA